MQRQCESLGVNLRELIPDEAVREAQASAAREFEVWPEHWDAVQVFMACDTQWTVIAGMGGAWYQGLDYLRVAQVRRELRIRASPQLFAQIRVLESEGLAILNAGR